ncbi:unannotated protein [freshwater metagenome]|uniref:Unannotated protein n=1 Tax=freshwater metagenome TaxID=449393 RepID=A0A6J7XSE4_9ZZZZ|nr:5-formyltetrahydrofolate cyclo-ligase [Actinomycetota bacterium]
MEEMEEKLELRKKFRLERAGLYISSSYSNLLSTPEILDAKVLTSYFSYGNEPSTYELNKSLIAAGKKLLLPRVNGGNIDWIVWDGNEKLLQENKNILEPTGEVVTDTSDVDVVIVPALRIDTDGYRIGQGGGFYDKALPLLPGWKIGIVHPGELISEILPREPHDIALDAAATPDLIVRFKR